MRSIVSFSLPYLLSYFLQTLYGMADLFIVGQFGGVDGTTAVSVGSQVMHMLTVMIVGLAMGSTVMIGRAVGGRDQKRMADTVGNTVFLFMMLSFILMAGLLFSVQPIVKLMSTPTEAADGTMAYLRICFMGIPFITAYNIISSIFRGMGDSKSPMYFIAVACAANILLDYLFIGAMQMGAAGAALGTTLSQTLSVGVAFWFIRKRQEELRIGWEHLKLKRSVIGGILKIGIPVALQDGLIQIAFIIITVIANRRGLDDAAAVGIVEKMISMLFLVPSSMLSTVSALGALNIGAGKEARARRILGYASGISIVFGICIAVLMQFTADAAVSLFSNNADVVRLGGQYMRGYVWDCVFAGIHFCFSGYFCACGLSGISFLHNVISIAAVRVPMTYLMSHSFPDTLFPMGLASPAGSFLSVLICVAAYLWLAQKEKKTIRE